MKFTKLAAAITLGLAFSAAHAATQNSSFNVKITIDGTCAANTFSNGPVPGAYDVDFLNVPAATGPVSLTANNSGAATGLTVQCSKGHSALVTLQPSNANASGAGVMSRVLGGTDTIPYQLVQPTPAGSPVAYTAGGIGGAAWGNNPASTLTVIGQGMTTAIKLPVAATITTNNALDVEIGAYSDLVTATMSY